MFRNNPVRDREALCSEIAEKIALLRTWIAALDAGAMRLRGTDWFAWATAGGSSAVLLAAETGIAEILVTPEHAFVLTDAIEAQRLQDEEVAGVYEWNVVPWADVAAQDRFALELASGRTVVSDRPNPNELLLPRTFVQQRYVLTSGEVKRYAEVGRLAADAMTEVMSSARATWTEFDLAGAGAEALWSRGLHPALTLASGERRLPLYRHPTPSREALGRRAMLVFCARGHGLYANLTRFVEFGLDERDERRHALLHAEAEGLDACRPGALLSDVYKALKQAYEKLGEPEAIHQHHQGGITGYLAREVVATPATAVQLENGMAFAFNPSFSGIKVEDTFVLDDSGLRSLTSDRRWPTELVSGRARPLAWQA